MARALGRAVAIASLALALLARSSAPARAQDAPAPGDAAAPVASGGLTWRQIAGSPFVVVGTVRWKADGAKSAAASGGERLTIEVEPTAVLKGKLTDKRVEASRYVRRKDPRAEELDHLNGTECLMALIRSGKSWSLETLVPSSPASIEAAKREVETQSKLLETFASIKPTGDEARRDGVVAALVAKLAGDESGVQPAVDELVQMGNAAVPSLVRHLDDRRPMSASVTFENKSPDAFEGLRHYGPKQVVDAVAAILNQITGDSPGGFIYNGTDDDSERAAVVAGWRVYSLKVFPAK